MLIMKTGSKAPFILSLAGGLAVLLLAAGCSDPADGVHKAAATDPARTATDPGVAGKVYALDSGSTISFVGSKVTGSHDGGFRQFSGEIKVDGGKILAGSEIRIDMDSTWSDNDRLTGHLKSADFFEVETYPESTFTVTSVVSAGAEHTVTGNLTLHGVTKSISFPAEIQLTDEAVTLRAEFAINRKDFDIHYPGRPDDLIRDNVVIKLDVSAKPV